MKRPDNYNTKQREAILAFIAALGEQHATAAQLVEHFKRGDVPIGRTTVYRHLEKLAQSGKVRKYTVDGVSGACYQFAGKQDGCREHFHLKCESCGGLIHLQCDIMEKIREHIKDDHEFEVNNMKTVLYGRCRACSRGV